MQVVKKTALDQLVLSELQRAALVSSCISYMCRHNGLAVCTNN